MSYLQEFATSRNNGANGETQIGQLDRLWYDPINNVIRVSDGVTPGGTIVGSGPGGNGQPAGGNTQVQFNDGNLFGASSQFTFAKATSTLTVANLNTVSATISNRITAGNIFADYANISGVLKVSNISNLFIDGGSNGYYLQTNGTGALTWAPQADSLNANRANYANIANVANLVAAANVIGTVANATYAVSANIANVANIANSAYLVNGSNVSGAVSNAIYAVSANSSNIASVANSVAGANVTGTVANATYAITAETVTANAQPNITSVGTLTNLVLSGNITPSANLTFNLGNTTHRWKDLYISGNTIYIGTSSISANASGVTITNPDGSNVEMKPGGSNTQVQFNKAGSFGGSGGLTYTESNTTLIANNIVVNSNITLGNPSTITITGGTNRQVLSTDGAGNLSWSTVSSNGGNANPGGSNTQIQFNDSDVFAGSAALTFNKTTNTLSATTVVANLTGNVTGDLTGVASSATSANIANVANRVAGANVTGTVANATHATTASTANSVAAANVVGTVATATTAETVTTGAQPNIYSLGTLLSLTVSGNITAASASPTPNIKDFDNISANTFTGSLTTAAQPNITSTGTLTSLTVSGNSNLSSLTVSGTSNLSSLTVSGTSNLSSLTVSGNSNLGAVGNLRITGGTNKQFLQTNGNGNVVWASPNNIQDGAGNSITITGGIAEFSFNNGGQKFDISNTGVSTNSLFQISSNTDSSGGVNLLSNNFAQLQYSPDTANADPYTLGNTNWAYVDGSGFRVDVNVNSAAKSMRFSSTGNLTITNSFIGAGANLTGNLTVGSISTLGNVGNVKITGGSNGQFLSTDGNGNLSWKTASSGNVVIDANANVTVNTLTANTVTVIGTGTPNYTSSSDFIFNTGSNSGAIVVNGSVNATKVMTLTPQSSAPVATAGSFATALPPSWDPASKGGTTAYPVFYNGTSWTALY